MWTFEVSKRYVSFSIVVSLIVSGSSHQFFVHWSHRGPNITILHILDQLFQLLYHFHSRSIQFDLKMQTSSLYRKLYQHKLVEIKIYFLISICFPLLRLHLLCVPFEAVRGHEECGFVTLPLYSNSSCHHLRFHHHLCHH